MPLPKPPAAPEVVEAHRKGSMGGLWVEAPWQPCILYSARPNFNVKVLDFVQFGGADPTSKSSRFSTPSGVPFSLSVYRPADT